MWAIAPDGTVYFSDIPMGSDKGMVMRFDPRTRRTTVFSPDSGKSNGLFFDAEAIHGPEELKELPAVYLSIIVSPPEGD